MIKLSKGTKINLTKENQVGLSTVYFGLDWGAIEKKGLFGFGGSTESVDLDAVAILLDENKKQRETVYFRNLKSSDGNISLSGDDRTGDTNKSKQGDDNEIISCMLNKVDTSKTKYILFSLSSFSGHTFDEIPYATLHIYTKDGGTKKILATLELTNNSEFKGAKGMVMGYVKFEDNAWEFTTLSKPTRASRVSELELQAPHEI